MGKFNKWFYIKPFNEKYKNSIKDKITKLKNFQTNTVHFYALRFTSNSYVLRLTETAMLPQENDRLMSIEDALYVLDLALMIDKDSLYNTMINLSIDFDIENLSLIQQDVKND